MFLTDDFLNIDELKLNIFNNNMNKIVTKKLFTEKVLKELKTHPYYQENKYFFSKTIQNFKQDKKHNVTSDILQLLEQNFKYKNIHKKKFKLVMNDLIQTVDKKNHQILFHNVLDDFKIFYNKRNRYNRYNNNHLNKIDDYSFEMFILYFFIFILLLKIYSIN